MAVARPLLRQRISPLPFLKAPQTTVPTTSISRPSFFSSSAKLQALSSRRIPDNQKVFFKSNGTLITTKVNEAFLRDYNVTHDNGILYGGPRLINFDRGIFRQFGVSPHFTTRHVISVYRLAWLDPRGHPTAAHQRERHKKKALNEPLWLEAITVGGVKAVVRSTAMRRLRAAVYLGLQARGYDKYGRSEKGNLTGTLGLSITDPLKAVSADKLQDLGVKLVQYMEATQLMPPEALRPRPAGKNHDKRGYQSRGRK